MKMPSWRPCSSHWYTCCTRRTAQAGFVTDFTGLLHRLDGATFGGVWTCFGFPAMHQVTNFFLYFFVKWFGVGGIGWYLVFTSLHVANGFMGFVLAKKIFAKNGQSRPFVPALMASLLFLLSPYQAEVVVWRVCFNFLFCTLLMLGSLLFLLKYLEGKKTVHLLVSHGLFVVALFTFELALALPLLALALYFLSLPKATSESRMATKRDAEVAFGNDKSDKERIRKIWQKIMLPYALLLLIYFLLNKLILGGWAGHYGEAVHLNFDLRIIAANCLKYFTKYLLFWREWPHGGKEWLVLFFEKPAVAWSGLAVGLLAVSWLIKTSGRYKTSPTLVAKKLRLAGIGWLLFFLALAPVANLYVAYVLNGENDRYGYLPSLFFFIGLVALLDFFPRWLRNGLFAAWLVVSIFFLQKMTVYWHQSARIVSSLLADFRWQDAPEVYVLASPENLHGVPMFKDFSRENLALKHALRYLADKPAAGDFYQVAQFNLTAPTDGFTASRDSTTGIFRLQFKQWGNWWWLYGMGLGDYQTAQYRFRTDGNGCRVEMKQWPPKPGAVFIVAQGDRWEEI
ncbi:MAG: hypothetical protein IPM82_11260 [Saprospiraceae bacterium]|nr:hypothetical protein [Saprospiraceae bacterium]